MPKKPVELSISIFAFLILFGCGSSIRYKNKVVKKNEEKEKNQTFHSNIERLIIWGQKQNLSLAKVDWEQCTLKSGKIPSGLELTKDCQIIGTTTALLKPETLEINGISKRNEIHLLSVKLTPKLPWKQLNDISLFLKTPENIDVLETTFKKDIRCSINPPLPEGMEINTNKGCRIEGYGDTISVSTPYTMTINLGGFEDSITFNLGIISEEPHLIGNEHLYFCSNSLNPSTISFKNIGNTIENCTIDPSLPQGLELDTKTCEISGSTATESLLREYNLTASSTLGTQKKTITLSIQSCDRPRLAIANNKKRLYFYKDFDRVHYNFLNLSSQAVETCEISPDLPKGLFINHKNCTISGTPKNSALLQYYTIKATSKNGNFEEKQLEIVIKDAFKTKWKTTTENETHYIKIPVHLKGSYNFDVNWGDSTVESVQLSPKDANQINWTKYFYHEYEEPGVYEVAFKGEFMGLRGAKNLVEVLQFGSFRLADPTIIPFAGRRITIGNFEGASDLIFTAKDPIDTYEVTSLHKLFKDATNFNSPFSMDTSNIEDMSSMFENAENFNKPIAFKTSNVKNLTAMFMNAKEFNQEVIFDTPNLTSFSSMFRGAQNFNKTVKLDTSKVKDFSMVFAGAEKFDKSIDFDTHNATNMEAFFAGAFMFNQKVKFETKNVTSMAKMFSETQMFNQDILFNTSNVENMSFMFQGALAFNKELKFDTSKVKDMSLMFNQTKVFNQDLHFNTSNVEDMTGMFSLSEAFNGKLFFDTSHVTNMSSMFRRTHMFNQELTFNTISVTDMSDMFSQSKAFNKPINFDTRNVENFESMFEEAEMFNGTLNLSDTSSGKYFSSMFANSQAFNQSINEFDFSSATSIYGFLTGAQAFFPSLTDEVLQSLLEFEHQIDYKDFDLPVQGRTNESDQAVQQLKDLGWSINTFEE